MSLNTFCQFPWTQLIVNAGNNHWRWCPVVESQKNFLQEYPKQNQSLNTLRSCIDSGKRNNACRSCWSDEDLGFRSFRQQHGGDVFLGPGNHHLSMITIELEESNNREIIDKLINILSTRISHVRMINIRARRFTNTADMLDIIDLLANSQSVAHLPELRILTNGWYEWDLCDKLSCLKQKGWITNVIFQLEAVDKNLDFMRGQSQWDTVSKNFLSLVEQQHCNQIEINVTALNLHMLSGIPNWLNQQGIVDQVKPRIHMEHGFRSITVLGELSLYLSPGLSQWKEHSNWADAVNKIHKTMRKLRFVKPKKQDLVRLTDYIKQNFVHTGTVPVSVKKVLYLADIMCRHITEERSQVNQDDDPVVDPLQTDDLG